MVMRLYLSFICLVMCASYGAGAQCRSQDVMFVVDGSASVGSINFEKTKAFLNKLVSEMQFGRDKTQVGAIQFSFYSRVEFPLQPFDSDQEVHAKIQAISMMSSGTHLRNGLLLTLSSLQANNSNDRPNSPNSIIVITDGKSYDGDVRGPAQQMRDLGWITYAIGVTPYIDDAQLRDIAGDDSRVFKVPNFDRLDKELMDNLIGESCLATPIKTCTFDEKKDRQGKDMAEVRNVPNVAACCEECKKRDGCVAFSYISMQSPFLRGKCWLKNEVPTVSDADPSLRDYTTSGVLS